MSGIGDPTIDGSLAPARAVDAYLDLRRERAFGDLAINGGAGKSGAVEHGLEADDAFGIRHGAFSLCYWQPSTEHIENFLAQRKGQSELAFGQFFNDLHDLNRLWTVRDFCGKPLRRPRVWKFFRSARFCDRHAKKCDGSGGFLRQRCRMPRTNHVFFRAVGLAARFESLPER